MANDNVQWTSEQMIANANNWSLAGDVALLNSLKRFSETLISNTESVSAKVDNLLNNLETVSLKLELTKNEFQSLRNTQFIENRVYEDDETFEHDVNEVKEKELTDEDKENAIKKSISRGLEVIKKYYDRVELAVSDSEGEGNENSYVLQPKDPYAHRPLPYLVGSQDWYKEWHVGLLPSESELESEKETEVYSSDSDSEQFLPKNRYVGSETSSDLDFTNRNAGPVANSTFNNTQDRREEVLHSPDESAEQSSSLPAKTPISNEKFAEQLAAKLGDVISSKNEASESHVKAARRITEVPKYESNLFSDEPPPLNSSDDTVLPDSAKEGLFSGSKNIFSETDDNNDLFWNAPPEKRENVKEKSEVQKPASCKQSGNIPKSKVPKGLFDNSDSSSEEDMLTVTEKRKILTATVTNPYLRPNKATVPFVDDQPPEITPKNENGISKKKLAGSVAVLGPNTNLFAGKFPTREQAREKPVKKDVESTKKPGKKKGLFDESSDDDMFMSNAKVSEPKYPEKSSKSEGNKKLTLFEDSDDFTPSKASEVTKKQKGLFDDEDMFGEPTDAKVGLFDEDFNTSKEIASESQHTNKAAPKKAPKKISLFDDDDDFYKEEEDIFANVPKKKSLFSDLEESTKSSSKGLFANLEDDVGPSGKNNVAEPAKNEGDLSESDIVKKQASLFEHFESEDEDLFKVPKQSITNKIGLVNRTDENSLFESHTIETDVAKESEGINRGEQEKQASDSEDTNEDIKTSSSEPKGKSKSENVEPISVGKNSEEDNVVGNLKEGKKEVSETSRKNVGLFDSESENASDEDIFAKADKRRTNETEQAQDQLFSTEVVESKDDLEANGAQPNFTAPPPISLFDPTPPPVDWDATSDQSGESDTFSLTDGILERSSYNQTQPTSSSLFDEAPPSLDVNDLNYSSGIVRDINATRVETDDSSFYPHASSSRRLSSDIFSDQQSQDSFFVSRNAEQSQAQASSLEKIPEKSEDGSSKIENLTPSGIAADFESNSSVFSADHSNDEMHAARPTVSKKPEIQKKISLFSDDNEQKKDDVDKKPEAKASPGKLKHNLNINVGALLPGMARPRIRPAIAKSVSLDETDNSSSAPPPEVIIRPNSASTVLRSKSELFGVKHIEPERPGDGTFGNLSETEVLRSITKDRARIPVKRRPSSRRARQDAVKKLEADFGFLENAGETAPVLEQTPSADSHEKPIKPDDDIKKVTSDNLEPNVPVETEGISLVFDKSSEDKLAKTDSKSLFDAPNTDLFAPTSKGIRNEKGSLFEDLDKSKSSISVTEEGNEKILKPDTLQNVEPHSLFDESFEAHDSLFNAKHKTEISSKDSQTRSLFEEANESIFKTNASALSSTNKSIVPDESSSSKDSQSLFENNSSNFKTTSLKKTESSSEADQKTAKKKDDLFGEEASNDSDEDLFSSASKLSKNQAELQPKETAPKKSGLFSDKSDSDSEGDLFGSKPKAPVGPVDKRKKPNIFDDSGDSSEEDLFGSKTAKNSSGFNDVKGVVVGAKRGEIKTATVKKLENKEVTDFDPLSGFK